MAEFKKDGCIQGFHVYQWDNWTPIFGEQFVYM